MSENRHAALLGEVRRFCADRLPDGWTACDGGVVPIDAHQPLFSLLGWRFGGDGWTTFRIPALRSAHAPLLYGIAISGIYPTRHGPMAHDAHVGEIRLFGGEHAPAGWLPCDGRTLPIADPYLELYAAIGRTWGGDDRSFALPDLQSRTSDGDAAGRLTYIIAAAARPETA